MSIKLMKAGFMRCDPIIHAKSIVSGNKQSFRAANFLNHNKDRYSTVGCFTRIEYLDNRMRTTYKLLICLAKWGI